MNDFERQAVPHEKTLSWIHIALVYTGVALTIPAFFLIADVTLSLGYYYGCLAILLSSIILSTFGIMTGVVGSKTNLSSYMIITNVFGCQAAKVINILFVITLVGWFGVTATFFAQAANNILELGYQSWLLIGTLLMIFTAIYGFRGLHVFSLVVVPFLLIFLYTFAIISLKETSFSDILSIPGNRRISFGSAVSMLVGGMMVGVAIFPDLTRYTKSAKDGALAGVTSFMVTILFALPIMIPVLYYQQANIVELIQKFGYPLWALLLIILASWSSNDNNLYSGALSLTTIFKNVSKSTIVLALATCGYIFSAINITNYFVAFLMFLSIIIPPIASIYSVDFLINNKLKMQCNINYKALIAWFVGVLVALFTAPKNVYGLEFFSITTIPALDGYLVSGFVYYLLHIKKLNYRKSSFLGKNTSKR